MTSNNKDCSNSANNPPISKLPAISSDLIVSDSISIDQTRYGDNSIYYIECRPLEAGRCVIVEATDGTCRDVLPAPYSARSRVHEYGGGSYCLGKQQIYFINDSDQDIYCINGQKITRITTETNKRFADFCYDPQQHRLLAVCETHENQQVTNSLVTIDLRLNEINTLEEGYDFYASPRLNSTASQLCWQCWNHPNMPWDGNQLWLAELGDKGQIIAKKHIAGAENISTFQPQWSPDDILHFISDDTGWWHLYRYLDKKPEAQLQALTEGEKDFGLPQWIFAQSSYAFIDDQHIVCRYQSKTEIKLALLAINNQPSLCTLQTPWQDFFSLTANGRSDKKNKHKLCYIAASGTEFPQLISAIVDIESKQLTETVIKSSCQLDIAKSCYSSARPVSFINRHNQPVYANFYAALNCSDNNEPPPLIVICHGGPTGQSGIALDPKKQFWTSRGFALLDVNYSGSTGYGRDYRNRLSGKWGQLDVEDCCDAAIYAVAQGMANKDQLIIRGSSAGGFTVLAALTFQNVFSAGASYYGISELNSLAEDTHKFESRYLDRLIGPYPESKTLYDQRSPINHADSLNCPVIFFQGMEDNVVPKEQAEQMFDALNKKGLPVAAQYFAGEQHGFRKAETIIQSLENELSFYQLIFKLKAENEIHFMGNIELKNI